MSKKIGKYTLEKELKRETYGTYYIAKDENGNKYAIKKIEIVKKIFQISLMK